MSTAVPNQSANGSPTSEANEGPESPRHVRRLSTGSRDMVAEFFAAVKAGYIQDVKKLVRRGVDINTADALGQNPLHIAAYNGEMRMVEYLIDQGVDTEAKTNDGLTPYALAVLEDQLDVAKFIRTRKISAAVQADRPAATPRPPGRKPVALSRAASMAPTRAAASHADQISPNASRRLHRAASSHPRAAATNQPVSRPTVARRGPAAITAAPAPATAPKRPMARTQSSHYSRLMRPLEGKATRSRQKGTAEERAATAAVASASSYSIRANVGAAPKPVFTAKDTEPVTSPTSDAAESPSRDASRASSSGSSAGHESVRTIDSHNMASGLQYHNEAAKPSAPQPLSFDERLHEHSASTTGNGHAPAGHLTGKLSFRALDRVKSGHQLMHQQDGGRHDPDSSADYERVALPPLTQRGQEVAGKTKLRAALVSGHGSTSSDADWSRLQDTAITSADTMGVSLAGAHAGVSGRVSPRLGVAISGSVGAQNAGAASSKRGLSHAITAGGGKESVLLWLNHMRLGTYASMLVNEGYDSLDRIAMLDEDDLSDIAADTGMTIKRGHRKQLLAAIEVLRSELVDSQEP